MTEKLKKHAVSLVCLALLSALALNLSMVFFRFPLARQLYEIVVRGNEYPVYFATGVDRLLDSECRSGNVFIRFEGFSKGDGEGISGYDRASQIYFRAAYHLYPRKALVFPPDKKIVRGFEFLDEPFEPDSRWLRQNNVSAVLTFTMDPGRNIGYKLSETNK